MRRILLFISLQIFAALSLIAQPQVQWTKCFGGVDAEYAGDVKQTPDKGFIIAGSSTSSNTGDVGPNHGDRDVWVVKLDSALNIEWEKLLGGTLEDGGNSVELTPDGGYMIAGYTYSNDGDVLGNHGDSDIWVVRLDSQGNIIWQRCYGSGGSHEDKGYQIMRSGSNYIILAHVGWLNGDVTTWNGYYDVWIAAINDVGDIQWEKSYGADGYDKPGEMVATNDGGYAFCGQACELVGVLCGDNDYLVGKIDSVGNTEWLMEYGGTESNNAYALTALSDGNFVVVGGANANSNYDWEIIKVNPYGDVLWQKVLGGSQSEVAYSVEETGDGGLLISGSARSADGNVGGVIGLVDSWLVKLDYNGNIVWKKCYGGSLTESPKKVWEAPNGLIYIFGTTASNDYDVFGNHGSNDLWFCGLSAMDHKISGTVFSDANSNCVMDTGETVQVGKIVQVVPGPYFATTALDGTYELWVDSGSYTVSLAPQPYWINECPANPYQVNFVDTLTHVSAIDFSSSISNYCVDLNMGVGTSIQRRCFNNNQIVASVCNNGTITADSTYVRVHFPIHLTPVAASLPYTQMSEGVYSFYVGDLAPGQCVQINITNTVSCDAELNSVKCIYINAISQSTNCNQANTFTSNFDCVVITGSYDPNDKRVVAQNYQTTGYLEENNFAHGDTLRYMIRFQNTGNDTAFTVVIRDTLSSLVDPLSLVTEVASHNYSYRLYGQGIAEWRFDNILLPDSFVNEPMSHGFVKFKIMPVPDLPFWTEIYNGAAIYFDYNSPVITNTSIATLTKPGSIDEQLANGLIKLYPNPTKNEVLIESPIDNFQYQLFDVSGREVIAGFANNKRFILDVSAYSQGIYFLKVGNGKQQFFEKLVKE